MCKFGFEQTQVHFLLYCKTTESSSAAVTIITVHEKGRIANAEKFLFIASFNSHKQVAVMVYGSGEHDLAPSIREGITGANRKFIDVRTTP